MWLNFFSFKLQPSRWVNFSLLFVRQIIFQVLFCASKALWSSWIFRFSIFSDSVISRRWQDSMAEGKRRRLSQVWAAVFNWHLLTISRLVFVALVLHVSCSGCYVFVVLVVTHLLFWLGFKEPWGLYLSLDSHWFCRFCRYVLVKEESRKFLKHAP